MKEDIKNGYIAGIISSVVAVILLWISFQLGFSDQSGQFVAIFSLLFGALGGGSFWKPKTIGKVASQLLKNIAENMGEEEKKTYHKQSQHKTRNSNQAGRDITIIHNHNGSRRKNPRKPSSYKRRR